MSRIVAWAVAGVSLAGAAGAQTQPELLFQAEAQTMTGTCTGEPVRLEGNRNTVTLSGPCGSLLLKGVSNTVRLATVPGGVIHVEGSGNRVMFTARDTPPVIEVLGPDNDVSPAPAAVQAEAKPGPPTPRVAAGPLSLSGDDQQRGGDCAGGDVTITGNRSAYVLRGACKSVTVKGDLLAVQAELAPGAKVSVTGRGSIVTWQVKGKGRSPVAAIHGEASRVQRAEPVGTE